MLLTKEVMVTKDNGKRKLPFDKERYANWIRKYTTLSDLSVEKIISMSTMQEEISSEQLIQNVIDVLNEETDVDTPHYTFEATKVFMRGFYKRASRIRSYDSEKKYGDFYGLLKKYGSEGYYHPNLLKKYSKEDIKRIGEMIVPERDELFTYVGLFMLYDRYLAKTHDKAVFELPQERWMIIAMWLMQDEEPNERRLQLVEEAYWAMSNLYMTVATPTLSSAGKTHGQLSSCFISTIDDDLRNIYDGITDMALLSKSGGGIGVSVSKVRPQGSSIKGFKGAAGGIVPFIKNINETANAVDQLGTRSGAIAIYLDVWHLDTPAFLDLKLNNGDLRRRAHDLFYGVVIPDLFMEQVEKRGEWYLFDPHEIRQEMGWKDEHGNALSLEDFYDEEKGKGSFRDKYYECVNNPNLTKQRVNAIDIMKGILRAQLETGAMFMFYKDTVNRANPNKHAGMIYSSNLCC